MNMRIARGGRIIGAIVAAALILPLSAGSVSAADEYKVGITVTPDRNTFSTVGEVITMQVRVFNQGGLPLTNGWVKNESPAMTFENSVTPPSTCHLQANPMASMPNKDDGFYCKATYTVTQQDLDNGRLSAKRFFAYATDGFGDEQVQSATPPASAIQTPAIELTKTVTQGSPFAKAGDVITYSLVAENTGNVTLTDVQIVDPKLGALSNCSPALGATLAPGAQMTCTGSYTVKQSDVDAGKVDNQAQTSGQPPTPVGGQQPPRVTDSDDATVPGSSNPAIDLVKTANPKQYVNAGDVIDYTLVATNTGNVTLTDVVVTDPKIANLVCVPATPTTLAPKEKTTCTGKYTVVEADLEAGEVKNTARVTGQPPGGKPPVTDEDTAIVTGPVADLAITKTHTPTSVTVGQDVAFTLTVKNNGPGTAYGVTVTDTLPAQLQFISASGTDWTCTHAAQIITCKYGKPLPSAASTQIAVVTNAASAGTQIVNVAVVESKTPDPDPTNNRAEDVVGVTKDARVCPTDIVTKPGSAVIPGCRDVQIRVLCKVKKPSAAGQISYCRVKQRKNGSVRVISRSQYPVKVKVVWFSPATDEYKAFRKVERFTLKPNMPTP